MLGAPRWGNISECSDGMCLLVCHGLSSKKLELHHRMSVTHKDWLTCHEAVAADVDVEPDEVSPPLDFCTLE